MNALMPILSSIVLGVYAGYSHASIISMLLGSICVATITLFHNWRGLRLAREDALGVGPIPVIAIHFSTFLAFSALVLLVFLMQSIAYLPFIALNSNPTSI